jgi:ribosomal protein S18 acetylase RimI-like enzyme
MFNIHFSEFCRFMKIETINKENIQILKDLWQSLNKIHINGSIHFRSVFERNTFEKRTKSFMSLEPGNLHIDVLYDKQNPVGYCIATIIDNSGEIESLYIDGKYQKLGYGHKLLSRSIYWLEKNSCDEISVSVASGNESVFGFYEKHGFRPRMTSLRRRKMNTEHN